MFEPEGTAAAYRLGNLARALDRAGYETTVLTTASPAEKSSTKRIRRWPVLRDSTGSVRGYVQYASFDIPLFFRLLFGPQADFVIAEPPPTTGVVVRLACWLRRMPYIYFSADVTTSAVSGMRVNPLVVRAVRMLERLSLRGAARILAISEGVKQEIIPLGADPALISVVGTGIDTEVFSIDGPRTAVDYPYFIYAGMMSEFQGAEVFVDGFLSIADRYPDARLFMFGAGVEVDKLRRRASRLSHRISFPGLVGADEIASWLRGSTASLASIRPGGGYDFAFPTKALASISCGIPVIYSGPGPMANLVQDNDLGWATAWEPDAVAAAMSAALASPDGPDPRLSRWIESNYSLRAVSERAVSAIVSTIAQ